MANGEDWGMISPEQVRVDWAYLLNMQELGHAYLLQSTGLRDKNGVLIFEGDIVSVLRFHAGRKDPSILRFAVEWLEGKYIFRHGGIYDAIFHDRTTIIGNIHQNPELLNEDLP